jgi:DNA-binding PadR family transcriptional regulator
MKPRLYHILLALADDDRHGLAIAREVERLSGGEVRLWPAALYGSLEALVEQGWIEELAETPADESERRRYYRLTRQGRRVLAVETERLADLVKVARARVRRAGGLSS